MLEDAIIGYFVGHSPQTTTNNSYAVLTLIMGLKDFFENKMKVDLGFKRAAEHLEKDFSGVFFGRKHKLLKGLYNINASKKAGYVKHADQDPLEVNGFIGIEDLSYLTFAVTDYKQLSDALTSKDLAVYLGKTHADFLHKEPRIVQLMNLFIDFIREYGRTNDLSDFERLSTLRYEYFEKVQQKGLLHRTKKDKIILGHAFERHVKSNPKLSAPAR
jgi:hypothetical protein